MGVAYFLVGVEVYFLAGVDFFFSYPPFDPYFGLYFDFFHNHHF